MDLWIPPEHERLILPLLRQNLARLTLQELSKIFPFDPATAALRAARHGAALDAARRFSKALSSCGIRHFFLKGPILQELLYKDRATRPYSDLDVWVERTRLPDALNVARECGWEPPPRMPIHHFHAVCRPVGAPLPLELHVRWVDQANFYRLPDDAGIERLVDGEAGLPRLSATDLLLYLCVHAQKHGFLNETALEMRLPDEWFLSPESGNRLVWWLDIALLLEQDEEAIDWIRCREQIAAWNLARPVIVALRLVERFLPESRAGAASDALRLELVPSGGSNRWLRKMAIRTPRWLQPTSSVWRPARLVDLPALFFPSKDELARFLGKDEVSMADRLAHPWRMARRITGL
ncbi:MAG: nucleotidyltransferase family protein [Kiritimatiellae bacterium]|nr:nucleotidyltransferase family protein [Kiritimatiellia bacterium]MDW8459146.1 nucleotidyltransferase family protein [Verrucomicrobiota bacterium]